MTGMVAPINGDGFEAYVAQVLVPELGSGDVVIMHNLEPQTGSREGEDRSGRRNPALPPALQPGLQPDREGFSGSKPCSARLAREPSAGSGT